MILYAAGILLAAVLVLAGAARIVRRMVRTSDEGPPKWWAVLVAATVLLAVPIGAVAAYLAMPAPVSERGLTNSIERVTDSAGLGSECNEIADGRWRCVVGDSSGSGSSDYEVATGWSCWNARRSADNAEQTMPARPEGCTTIRDCAGLWDLVTGG